MALDLKSGIKMDLTKIPVWVQVVILAVIPIAIATAFYFLQYQPKNTKIQGLLATIQKQQNEIGVKRAKALRYDDLKKENEWLKGQLKILTEQLPEEAEVSGLLRQISDLGKSADLDILSWVPDPKKTHPSGLYDELPIRMTLTGTFHKLGLFFGKVSSMTRIVNISNINIKAGATKGRKQAAVTNVNKVSFVTTAFTKATAPPPAAEPKAGKGKPAAAPKTKGEKK